MWLELQIFGFRALWSPYFLAFIICLAIGYFLITGPLRQKFGSISANSPSITHQVLFYVGLLLIYIVKGSPIDLMSHIMMSAHMIQTAILYFVVPILLIRGLPNWLLEKMINVRVIKPLFTFFTLPLIALALFNGLFALYHLPVIFDISKSNQILHSTLNIILFILSIFMWWPIVTPLKTHNKLNPLVKMGYLLASILMISIACALMIFSTESLYKAYSSEGAWIQALSLCVPSDVLVGLSSELSGAQMFSPLTAHEDQQLGGIIMMFLQQIFYGFVIAWIFFGWFSKKNLEVDPMPTSVPYSKQ